MQTDYQHAIEQFVSDWHNSGISKCLEFSQKVLKEKKVFYYKKNNGISNEKN